MTAPTRPPVTKNRRRRFRFSLNGLAIQLSAFALSFTLVALLVVSGSQAAFVEPSKVLENYVPIGTAAPSEAEPSRPDGARPVALPVAATPTGSETPAALIEEPEPEPKPEPEPELPDAEIELTDSAAGTALFGNETLAPGITVERCIAVTYTGSADVEPVQLYAAAISGDLAPYLDLTITMGQHASGPSSSCAGFTPDGTLFSGTLDGFAAAHSSYATGRSTWAPADDEETRGFRFSLSVRDDPAAAGRSATFGFSWRTEAP